MPTHTIHSTPAARARATCSSPPASCRWQWESTHRIVIITSLRGNSGSPLSSGAPAGSRPHAAASGSRWSSGRPGRPSRRHSSPAAFGITGDASSATIRSDSRQSPNTLATAAASPCLLSSHGLVSSMYAFVARMSSQTAPNPLAKSRRVNASDCPAKALAAASRNGPSARASGTTPPQ